MKYLFNKINPDQKENHVLLTIDLTFLTLLSPYNSVSQNVTAKIKSVGFTNTLRIVVFITNDASTTFQLTLENFPNTVMLRNVE